MPKNSERRTPRKVGTEAFQRKLEQDRAKAHDIPTAPESTFRISDFGFEEGGSAIVAIKRAFHDCWGGLALELEGRHNVERTYSFVRDKPIEIDVVPEESHDPEIHGPQVIGARYSYQFMRDIGEDNPITVVRWAETRGPDVEEVIYP